MSNLKEKEIILKEQGYVYDFDHMVYYNRKTKKIFSYEAINDQDKDWLSNHIEEKTSHDWQFYFNTTPNVSLRDKILKELKLC